MTALLLVGDKLRVENLGDAFFPSFEGSEAPSQSISLQLREELERRTGRLPTDPRLSKPGGPFFF